MFFLNRDLENFKCLKKYRLLTLEGNMRFSRPFLRGIECNQALVLIILPFSGGPAGPLILKAKTQMSL
jgi:hypothetical protein